MQPINKVIEKNFEDFVQNSISVETENVISQFNDLFMYAEAKSVQAVKKDDFAMALPKRKEFFSALGLKSTDILTIEQNQLDNNYTMVRVSWSMMFEKTPSQLTEIRQDSTFILWTTDGLPKIVFYLSHKDIMELLKESGLL